MSIPGMKSTADFDYEERYRNRPPQAKAFRVLNVPPMPVAGQQYYYTALTEGAFQPIVWHSDDLPSGLVLDAIYGSIKGSTQEPRAFTISGTDARGRVVTLVAGSDDPVNQSFFSTTPFFTTGNFWRA